MSTTTSPTPDTARRRFGGLDGLRAIAVAMVLVYHFFPAALRGGFLGVDVFFVISGFLIASLLLREWQATGRIALFSFWRRRARRLLPALGLVLLVCSSAALLVGGDVLVSIGAQIAGSAFFVSNWVFVALGSDYFARDNPEIYRNTWSLSIEEQFYLVLPFLLLLALGARSRGWRAMPFVVLSAGSAVIMAVLALQGAEPTRIYFGSDSHTFGLFMGVALALLVREPTPGAAPPRWLQPVTFGGAALGLGVLAWLAFSLREGSPESFAWGFQLASLAALLAVWSVTRPGALVGRLLDAAPLRWVGERSYGIYLWHWPVLVLLAAAPTPWGRDPDARWITGVLALAITMPLAILSYRFVEQPVRRHGLLRSLRALVRTPRLPSAHRIAGFAVVTLLLVTIPATAAAIAVAPQRSSAAEAIARGQEAAAQHGAPSGGSASQSTPTTPRPNTAPTPTPTPEPPPPPIIGDEIWAVGDSVMLASAGALGAQLPGVWIDADVSRSFGFGVSMIEQQASTEGLRPVLVLGLSTNGPVAQAELDWLEAASAGCRVVLVNAYGDRWWIPENNQALADFAAARPGVVVADWSGAIAGSPELLAGDGIHPGDQAAVIYAQAIQAALDALNSPEERPAR
ncbi:MAG: acyltransferase [Candidatus Leucobacter sulfamidivorax]|nr:acyltransferase [Candidatus Leucobacter sulfamidivorax]